MNKEKGVYQEWLEKAAADRELIPLLKKMTEKEIEDSFYCELAFGTGGLRGKLGPGTNRMNVYTVARASAGLAAFLKHQEDRPSVIIGRDSRLKSDLFAETAAAVLAENGIRVFYFEQILPTPVLSFAVRRLGCTAGIMVTASHNPAVYNGYKVYGSDGCQITVQAAENIYRQISSLDYFSCIPSHSFSEWKEQGRIVFPEPSLYEDYLREVQKSTIMDEAADHDVRIVYTPLNGTGAIPVTDILKRNGFNKVYCVEEQFHPDGSFPTCPKPNPEEKEAWNLAFQLAEQTNAELVLATDPDCDRIGIAVRDGEEYRLLSGNETGILFCDYILRQRTAQNKMPEHPVLIKTIVTTELAALLAEAYHCEVINVLTGFKYIGEQIGILEKSGREDDFVFGCEESCGYLSGSYVRDKDAVNASLLAAELFASLKKQGISPLARLQEIYEAYGYMVSRQYSYQFEGAEGSRKMKEIMSSMRSAFHGSRPELFARPVKEWKDYSAGIGNLPPADVLQVVFEDNASVILRPSGTEPKLKIYTSVRGENSASAEEKEKQLAAGIRQFFDGEGI